MTRFFKRNVPIGVCLTLGAALVTAGPVHAQTKEAQGTVTAVSNSSLTISSGGKNVTFSIGGDTALEVKAAARQTRQARSTDSPGVTITEYVKTGNAVIVRYREANGENHALSVRPVASGGVAAGGAAEPASHVAEGKVKSVSVSQLIVDSGGKDMAFAINADTDVLARGASKTTKAAGGKTTLADFVHSGDTVSVTYHEAAGTMTASQVRVRIANK